MEETIQKLTDAAVANGLNLLAALAIFIIGKWVAGVIRNLIGKAVSKGNTDPTLSRFFQSLAYTTLMAFVILAALAKLGIQTASFIAVFGAAGLAVGMALQGSLSNFAAGVLILLFRPYKVGDFINAGSVSGKVQSIQLFNTILHTPDNVQVILPNAQATSGSITNFSANAQRRVDLLIGVSYEDDIKKTKQVLMDTICADERVLSDPEPLVAVKELADSSVNFVVRAWVNADDYWPTFFALTEKIKIALDAEGISIPYPQQDVHLKASEGLSGLEKSLAAKV